MWTILSIRYYSRYASSSSTRASGPLLVILTLWRDIPHSHSQQRSNIYANLHSGCAAEYIDRRIVNAYKHVPKSTFVFLGCRSYLFDVLERKLSSMFFYGQIEGFFCTQKHSLNWVSPKCLS